MSWLAKIFGPNPAKGPTSTSPSKADERPTLEKSIRSKLAPILRADGFSGSGRTFRREIDGLIHVIQVQGSRYGGQFAVNLGIQPTCLTSADSTRDALKTLALEACAFRRRLCLHGADQWWPHLNTSASMDAAVADAAEVYVAVGRPAFAAVSGANSPIWRMTSEQFASREFDLRGFASTEACMAYVFALIRRAAGEPRAAASFAQYALDLIGDGQAGAGLRTELRAIVRGC